MKTSPVLLLILDGFGCRAERADNAIAQASKPNWDRFWKHNPHTLIHASESEVGLPKGQMGNSEVGHLNIGAGRVVYQEFTRIDHAIESGYFYTNPALLNAVHRVRDQDKTLHVLGLLSDGGVHSHESHFHALLELAAREGLRKVCLHVFLDGRDTPPKSAETYLRRLIEKTEQAGVGHIASMIGRYYAMDRDRRWQRVKSAYDLLTQGRAEFRADNPLAGLEAAYARGETDEFIKATAILPPDGKPVKMEDGDAVIFLNFRSDRARQLSRPFIEPDFSEFEREVTPRLATYCTLTGYSDDFDVSVAFPPERIKNGLGEYVANLGLRQLRIAETEKYPHVTFFFNGGEEISFPGEDRVLVPSPDVATYDLKPEMSAFEVTDKLLAAINGKQYDVIVCNYANPDMVGHTGDLQAAIKAIETVDTCLGRVVEAQLARGGEVLVTADHGNAELMRDAETGQAHTAHTMNLVPLIYIGRRRATLAETGALEDVSPTLLKMMGLPQPPEMTGEALLQFE
ncbi:2,3-bisphosphoglycerate-independent phosphoglycerate mutase [Thiobacillus sp. 65-1402]|uniref:2,3-bisphosphoglycerate-independent phosphoglycerate mutase n=1 Tax=Thiobacillus sp. 65-1402 TaxID=1895861 RepID=UPI00095CEF0E|nr:2,3-bisphosphoglycerate-independent phosphoglycerate mutase [Thiobacillus sp. 65-1402]OJW94017.1 MAG: phosphoglycerate mutase (2,3-diphosphoglycerate-independent) [Thiobacillus sp. 65-1402]